MTRAVAQRRRRSARLRGALGLLALAAVCAIGYVAYNATSGLPWQPRYSVTVEVPNANRLIDANDVRIGGIRIGQVGAVDAVPRSGDLPAHSRVRLEIDRAVGELPVDSRVAVRPASVLGATYVDVELGESAETVPDGGTLALSQADGTVELTDLLDVFDRETARSFRAAIDGLSGGFAGRGSAVNATIESFAQAMEPLRRVMRTLGAPSTDLSRFVSAYDSVTAALAPVSGELAALVSAAATTFDALAGESEALRATISAAPSAELATTEALRELRPGLDALAVLVERLEPASSRLPAALDDINTTLEAGRRPLAEMPRFAGHLDIALDGLDGLGRDPSTLGSLRKLTDLAGATNDLLEVLGPAQIHCNAVSLYSTNFSSAFGGLGVGHGPGLPALILTTSGGVGESFQNPSPSPGLGINPIPVVDETECEAGNEPFDAPGLVPSGYIGNPPGLQSTQTRDSEPPPAVLDRAREAGLLDDPEGAP